MVHQARFQNRFILMLISIIVLNGCMQPVRNDIFLYRTINSTSPDLKAVNGIIYLKDSLFNGTIFTLFPNSTDTAAIMNFKNGQESGIWKKKYTDNSLAETREFKDGKKVGVYLAFWPNGHKKLQYEFVNGEYEGTCYEWNVDGQLVKEANYRAGHEDGPQKIFYDNGKIRSNYIMINGRRFGLLGTKNCINVSDSIFK